MARTTPRNPCSSIIEERIVILRKTGLPIFMLAVGALVCACAPKHRETVEELLANPQHLKEVRQRCQENRAAVGEELCQASAVAAGRRLDPGAMRDPYSKEGR